MREIISELWVKHSLYFFLLIMYLFVGLFILMITPMETPLLYIAQFQSVWTNRFFYIVTSLGEPITYFVLFIFYLFKRYYSAFLIILVGLLSLLISIPMKWAFSHARPGTVLENREIWEGLTKIEGLQIDTSFTSFPSGHTFAAFALYTLIVLLAGKNNWVAIISFVAAMLVAISRLFLLQHFLKDVLFGSFCGVVTAISLYLIMEVNFRSRKGWWNGNILT